MKIRAYADLHLYYRREDMDRYNNEELSELKKELFNNPPDLLVFCGDLCHTTYKSDDIRFINIIKFITQIVDICKRKNVQFRILQGTSSHDGKIVSIIKNIFKNESHVKAFTEVEYENFNGTVIRYLPEPYFDTYQNFYDYAFTQMADITFFHGSIDKVLPQLTQKDNVTNLPKAIVMKQEDLLAKTRLFSAGGHIHKHFDINGKIFYINSLTTHNFSDVNNIKGYMEFTIENNTYDYKYIKNYNAPKYLDYKIEDIHTLFKEDIKAKIGNIMLASGNSKDNIRFTITGDMTREAIANVSYIRALMKKYNIKIITKYNEVQSENIISDEVDFFTDDSIDIKEKIKRIAKTDYNLDISTERISKLINENIK